MENLTLREIVDRYKKREFDIVAWNQSFIDIIKEKEPDIHAWAYFNETEWLNKLENVLENHPVKFSELLGVPVGIKDIFNTIDMPTCMGSPIWEGFTPGNDARVVHNIKFQGDLLQVKPLLQNLLFIHLMKQEIPGTGIIHLVLLPVVQLQPLLLAWFLSL